METDFGDAYQCPPLTKNENDIINPLPWYKELSAMTNGISVPFSSSHYTSDLILAGTMARGSHKQRMMFDQMAEDYCAPEMACVFESYRKEREDE
ncbi:MAG: hypothetical protein Q4B58_05570 [Bacteroidales bacterium]|nr:hypothetical protein [Bacteroidales bacterium]